MTWLTFFIAALACYRGTVLIVRCLGPWNIFHKLRTYDKCSKLLTCPYCVSVYVGAATCIGLCFSDVQMPLPMWIMLAFAFSGFTIAFDRVFSSDHAPKP